jgi:transposase
MPELGTYGSVRGVPSNGHSYRDREFHNRRQVGACVGLVPQPYDSGQSQVDQGISRQGNRRVRALLVGKR